MKRFQQLQIAVFFALLIAPTALWLAGVRSYENLENRTLAALPSLGQVSPTEFVRGLEAWYSDRLPYKNEAVRLQNTVDYQLFRQVNNNDVTVGSHDWFFYASIGDGNPTADYKGLLRFTPKEKRQYARLFKRATDNMANQGIDLYMIIAPNKEIAYQQYMPDSLRRVSTTTKTMDLAAYLEKKGIDNFLYLDSVNKAAETDDDLYYHLDTHWNLKGSYIAYRDFCELAHTTPVEAPLEQVAHHGGDLAMMVNLSLDEPAYFENATQDFVTDSVDDYENLELMHSLRENPDPRTIAVIGDSFRTSIKGHIASTFAQTAIIKRGAFTPESIGNLPFRPDIILMLSPERYTERQHDALVVLSKLEM